jgi:hypothetical protein
MGSILQKMINEGMPLEEVVKAPASEGIFFSFLFQRS